MVNPGTRPGGPYLSLCEYRNIQPRALEGCGKVCQRKRPLFGSFGLSRLFG